MGNGDLQLLYSSLDPCRRGVIPCHLLHAIVSIGMIKAGTYCLYSYVAVPWLSIYPYATEFLSTQF